MRIVIAASVLIMIGLGLSGCAVVNAGVAVVGAGASVVGAAVDVTGGSSDKDKHQ